MSDNNVMSNPNQGVQTQRQKSESAFNHVITNLFRQYLDGRTASSLLVYTGDLRDITQVIEMPDEDIDKLHYYTYETIQPDEKETKTKTVRVSHDLPKGSRNMIKVLKSFNRYMSSSGEAIYYDWSNITEDQFDEYRLTEYDPDVKTPVPIRLSSPSPQFSMSTTTPTTNKFTLAQQFKRSIKRDPSVFVVLKNARQFKNWHRTLIATAAAQDLSEVLDPKYVPQNVEEVELFEEKQKYMYQVADRILQTDRGVVFVGQHEVDFDAQKVFAKTLEYYLKSRTADIDASDHLTYITTSKFNPTTWNGTAIGFISNWQEQVRNYNKLVNDKDERLSLNNQ